MDPEGERNGLEEDHFPVPNELPRDATLVEGDTKAIQDKLKNYEQLDTEER